MMVVLVLGGLPRADGVHDTSWNGARMEEATQREELPSHVRLVLIGAVLLVPVTILEMLGFSESWAFGFFISIVLFWVTELIPLTVCALLVPVGAAALGFLEPAQAFASFGSPILFLLIGVFLLVRALQRHGVASRFAEILVCMPFVGGSIERLALVFTIASWLIGMWISNTATCALLIPVALGIAEALSQAVSDEDARRIRTRFLLISAFTPSIAGMATPIGSLPNLIALQALEKAGNAVNFADWMLRTLPVSFVLLVSSYFILRLRYPLGSLDARPAQALFRASLAKRGRLSFHEIASIGAFFSAVALWLMPPVFIRVYPENEFFRALDLRLHPAVVAILAALPLFVLRSKISRECTLKVSDLNAIDWGSIILFGGGLTLGEVLSATGLASRVGDLLAAAPLESLYALLLLTTCVAVALSEFSSNTAAAALLIPIVSTQAATLAPGADTALIMTTVFACGFGYLLPISTPPNAMVFGTKSIRLRDMLHSGAWLDLCGIALLPLYGAFILARM